MPGPVEQVPDTSNLRSSLRSRDPVASSTGPPRGQVPSISGSLRVSLYFIQSLPHELEMEAQAVEHIGVRQRHGDSAQVLFDHRKAHSTSIDLCRGGIFTQSSLDPEQRSIMAKDPRSHSPFIGWRQNFEQRIENGRERDEQHDHTIDEDGEPEGKKSLQEGRSLLQVTSCVLVNREHDVVRRWKLAGRREWPSVTVDLPSGTEQQPDQRRMQRVADADVGGHGDQRNIDRRKIVLQADEASRNDHSGKKPESVHVGIGSHEGHQSDVWG